MSMGEYIGSNLPKRGSDIPRSVFNRLYIWRTDLCYSSQSRTVWDARNFVITCLPIKHTNHCTIGNSRCNWRFSPSPFTTEHLHWRQDNVHRWWCGNDGDSMKKVTVSTEDEESPPKTAPSQEMILKTQASSAPPKHRFTCWRSFRIEEKAYFWILLYLF